MNTLAYIDIARHLRQKVQGIKHIDLYNGQFESPEVHIPANYPAVYIEFLPTQWDTHGQGVQRGMGGIRVYCVVKNFLGTENIDLRTEEAATQRLTFLQFEKAVHAALQNFTPSGYGNLMRSTTLPDASYNSVMVVMHEYQAAELDDSGYVYQQWQQAIIDDFNVPGEIVR